MDLHTNKHPLCFLLLGKPAIGAHATNWTGVWNETGALAMCTVHAVTNLGLHTSWPSDHIQCHVTVSITKLHLTTSVVKTNCINRFVSVKRGRSHLDTEIKNKSESGDIQRSCSAVLRHWTPYGCVNDEERSQLALSSAEQKSLYSITLNTPLKMSSRC